MKRKFSIVLIREQIFEDRWRWFVHVKRMMDSRIKKRVYVNLIEEENKRVKQKKVLVQSIKETAEKRGIG